MAASLDDFIYREDRNEERQRSRNRPPLDPIAGQEEHSESHLEKRQRAAFRNYLRSGFNGPQFGLPALSEDDRSFLRFEAERRDMGIGSPTASIPTSVLVPQGFIYDVEVALKYFGPMLDVSTILDTSTGQPLPYPTANDTTVVAEIVGEGAQVSTQDVSVASVIFGAWKLSSKLVR